MEAQLASGVPTVNGYSGKLPPGWQDQQPRLGSGAEEPNPGLFFIRVCTEADRQRLDKALRAWRARHGLKEADIQWITTRRNP